MVTPVLQTTALAPAPPQVIVLVMLRRLLLVSRAGILPVNVLVLVLGTALTAPCARFSSTPISTAPLVLPTTKVSTPLVIELAPNLTATITRSQSPVTTKQDVNALALESSTATGVRVVRPTCTTLLLAQRVSPVVKILQMVVLSNAPSRQTVLRKTLFRFLVTNSLAVVVSA